MADAMAKKGALTKDKRDHHDVDMLANELPFVVTMLSEDPEGKGEGDEATGNPAHGNVRKAIRLSLRATRTKEWAERGLRGELIRENEAGCVQLIKEIWRDSTTNKIAYTLGMLTQVRETWGDGQQHCPGCDTTILKGHRMLHLVVHCQMVVDLWNSLDEWLAGVLRLETLSTHDGPGERTIQQYLNKLGYSAELVAGKHRGTPVRAKREVLRNIARRVTCREAERRRTEGDNQRKMEAGKARDKQAREREATRMKEVARQGEAERMMLRLVGGKKSAAIRAQDGEAGKYGGLLGNDLSLWTGQITQINRARWRIRWLTIQPQDPKGEGGGTAGWSEGEQDWISAIHTKKIFTLDAPWQWNTAGTEAKMREGEWSIMSQQHRRAVAAQEWEVGKEQQAAQTRAASQREEAERMTLRLVDGRKSSDIRTRDGETGKYVGMLGADLSLWTGQITRINRVSWRIRWLTIKAAASSDEGSTARWYEGEQDWITAIGTKRVFALELPWEWNGEGTEARIGKQAWRSVHEQHRRAVEVQNWEEHQHRTRTSTAQWTPSNDCSGRSDDRSSESKSGNRNVDTEDSAD